MGSGSNIDSVFYATSYHPIQAGSIDGTDIIPHDKAIYRAHLCSNAGLYDPLGDPKIIGDPYCTVFVGRLSHLTTEDTLRKVMGRYGRVMNLRLVRDIVSGASRGYAFVEFETEREMLRAYKDAHHSIIDDCEIIVDYNRQQLMPGWIPRRLGGGLGGKKESGQLRFGGRERPFRAPLRPIPYEELKRLGIPPPPEGRYMSRFQVPPPPRRRRSSEDEGEVSDKRGSMERDKSLRTRFIEEEEHRRRKVVTAEDSDWSISDEEDHRGDRSREKSKRRRSGIAIEREVHPKRIAIEREEYHQRWKSEEREERLTTKSTTGRKPTDRTERVHRGRSDRERHSYKDR